MVKTEKKWFRDFKERAEKFYNISNAIESLKVQHSKTNHLVEWTIGISLVILLSLSISDILNNQKPWLVIVGYVGYSISLLASLVTMFLHVWTNKRQNDVMRYLYREKDERERKSSP